MSSTNNTKPNVEVSNGSPSSRLLTFLHGIIQTTQIKLFNASPSNNLVDEHFKVFHNFTSYNILLDANICP